MDKISYAVGVNIGTNLKSQGARNINAQDVAAGIDDVINGRTVKMTAQEVGATLRNFFAELEETQGKLAREEGEAFLAANKERAGVTTLPSGLQYEVLKAGTGRKPKATDTVRCHYVGTLVDGTEFDSSVRRGQPADFGVNQVIRGWVEALQLMPVGSKWKLFIPYELGYGQRGAGESIPPFSALIFEVELLDIL